MALGSEGIGENGGGGGQVLEIGGAGFAEATEPFLRRGFPRFVGGRADL